MNASCFSNWNLMNLSYLIVVHNAKRGREYNYACIYTCNRRTQSANYCSNEGFTCVFQFGLLSTVTLLSLYLYTSVIILYLLNTDYISEFASELQLHLCSLILKVILHLVLHDKSLCSSFEKF